MSIAAIKGRPVVETGQLLALGLTFLLLAVVNDVAYGMAAGAVRNWLLRSARRAETATRISGRAMIGLGIRLVGMGRTS